MKLRWLGVGSAATAIFVVTIVSLASASAMTPGGNYLQIQPKWNTGNLCTPTFGPLREACDSSYSADPTPLWYNFSAGNVRGVSYWVNVTGSADCIYLNFHGFYGTITINLIGSEFACKSLTGGTAPGVNIVVNSEGDLVTVNEIGSNYVTNLTTYGSTVAPQFLEQGSYLNAWVTYVPWSPSKNACPYGLTYGRSYWTVTQIGSNNVFNTIFVDGTQNVHWASYNYAYSTEPMTPLDGTSFGSNNLYGNETTQTVPPGVCQYLPQ